MDYTSVWNHVVPVVLAGLGILVSLACIAVVLFGATG